MSSSNEDIFLSGTRDTSSRTNVFRPKELREVVFPGLGMIMHSLFWVKHTFYLGEAGYELSEQDSLLLWANNGEPQYTESLLFYCVYSNMSTSGEMTVNAGQRTTNNWLFRRDTGRSGGIYQQLAENLRSLTASPENPDYATFIESTFAPWFRTRCRELDVDLEKELDATVGSVLDTRDPAERERELATAFATVVGQIVREHPSLRSGKGLTVISTTTNFARRIYEVATPEQREILANTKLELTAPEATALLESVSRMENGEHFLRSLIFILYLDPATHSRTEIEQQMRHLYDFVRADPEKVVDEVQSKYKLSVVDSRITTDIDATAFYWVLNFFMADGETIARDLLEEVPSPLGVDDVDEFFSENPSHAKHFRSFFDYTDKCRPYLSELVSEAGGESRSPTYHFIDSLLNGLSEEQTPAALFVGLLESQGTIDEVTDGQYQILTRPQNTNAASFYGIGPLVKWAETIATSVHP